MVGDGPKPLILEQLAERKIIEHFTFSPILFNDSSSLVSLRSLPSRKRGQEKVNNFVWVRRT